MQSGFVFGKISDFYMTSAPCDDTVADGAIIAAGYTGTGKIHKLKIVDFAVIPQHDGAFIPFVGESAQEFDGRVDFTGVPFITAEIQRCRGSVSQSIPVLGGVEEIKVIEPGKINRGQLFIVCPG